MSDSMDWMKERTDVFPDVLAELYREEKVLSERPEVRDWIDQHLVGDARQKALKDQSIIVERYERIRWATYILSGSYPIHRVQMASE